ncbi:hypothetical protein GGI15_004128 [Coemansia interrupta]|uniref:Uncharacterized protein n=1 Tax=Coemansia interrupta TaxID=1126814 RepID=A0A9W8H603_9FUNG|nr:hypothetical protein GGI15_004128 [Coemansia interrupta]
MTVVAPIPVVARPEYHWWDVVTERAQHIFAPKIERANKMFSQGREIAAESGDYVTSNVAEYGQQIKDSVDQAGQDAKNKAYELGQQARDSVDDMGQKVKDKADYWGKRAQHNAEHAKNKVQDDVHKAARHVKDTGEDFYDRLNYEGNRVAHEAECGARRAGRKCSGVICCIRRFVSHKLESFASFTRGSGSQMRSDLQKSMDRLREYVVSGAENATPTWPDKVLHANRDSGFSDYIHDLGEASQKAHSQIKSNLDIHTDILDKIVRSHILMRLPFAGCYVPIVGLSLIYLISGIWGCKAQLRHRIQQRANAASTAISTSGVAETTSAFQNEYIRLSDAITLSSTFISIVPMTTVILVIMELNGMAGWLISGGYTCLLAASFAATQMSTIADLVPSSNDSVVSVGQRVIIGISTILSVCCLVNGLLN